MLSMASDAEVPAPAAGVDGAVAPLDGGALGGGGASFGVGVELAAPLLLGGGVLGGGGSGVACGGATAGRPATVASTSNGKVSSNASPAARARTWASARARPASASCCARTRASRTRS